MHRKLTLIAGVMACWLVIQGAAHAQKPLAIRGGKIITMAGDTIENGTIVFRDGLITAVGKDVKIPVEARIIDATGKVVMPGFVEAHSSSGMSQANETNPIVPYVSV
ncbi:MAG: imidazolonepropionase-like amidohydrolase, partial [Mariniblastus sp.]